MPPPASALFCLLLLRVPFAFKGAVYFQSSQFGAQLGLGQSPGNPVEEETEHLGWDNLGSSVQGYVDPRGGGRKAEETLGATWEAAPSLPSAAVSDPGKTGLLLASPGILGLASGQQVLPTVSVS